MWIHDEMLQNFVDKIIQDIGHNINIIDGYGMIVASGSKDRIGTYHAIGHEAALKERRIDIHQDQIDLVKGVKEGVNQPFYVNQKLSGVIGITGNPEKILELVKIVKTMIELMIEQEILKQKIYFKESHSSLFINELLNLSNQEEYNACILWGKSLGYDMTLKRNMILIELNLKDDMTEAFRIQELVKQIKALEVFKKNDMALSMSYGKVILMTSTTLDVASRRYDYALNYANEIKTMLEDQLGLASNIGIGSYYDDLWGVKSSYEEATYVLDTLQEHPEVNHIEGCLMSYFISKVPQTMMEHHYKAMFDIVKDNLEYMETIVAMAESNMQSSLCASRLYVHRNTVLFRFNKIKELLSLDPLHDKKDWDHWQLLAEYIKLQKEL